MLSVFYKILQVWMKLVNILKLLDVFTQKIYFQLLHKASFYPPTCVKTTAAWNIYDIK